MLNAQEPLFELGRVLATPGAVAAMTASGETPTMFLDRHFNGDWGIVDDDDKLANEVALMDGSQLLSAYQTRLGIKLWIITEAENDNVRREATTILLPEEY